MKIGIDLLCARWYYIIRGVSQAEVSELADEQD